MTLQQTATIILALLATVAAGAGIVCYVAWRERRRAEDAQRQRDETARAWGETAADDPERTQRPIWRPD